MTGDAPPHYDAFPIDGGHATRPGEPARFLDAAEGEPYEVIAPGPGEEVTL